MSTRLFWSLLALPLLSLSPLRTARAEDMDLALSRLSRGNCGATLSDAHPLVLRTGDVQTLREDNAAWAQLVTQLTPAVTPAVLSPVTTSGPAGFDVSFETNVTSINDKANYWERGSMGHGPEALQTCNGRNRDVSPLLTNNRIHFAKALPLGFTIGATVGRVYNTSLWVVGGDIKLALIEGLRSWAMPDVAVRGAVNTTIGNVPYTLTSVAADLILSKNIVTARVMQLSPYAGAGMVFSFASSELIDLTPNVDAVACAAGTDRTCSDGGGSASADDIGHDRPFKDLSLRRYRGFAGLAMRYELFTLAAEIIFDLVPPHDADKSNGRSTPRQWTFNVAPGLTF